MRRQAAPYQSAMLEVPGARSTEFELPVTLSGVRRGERLLDLPSGGGYLRRYLPAGVDYIAAETVAGYASYTDVLMCDWDRIPLADDSIQVAISIAALHHLIDERPACYRELYRLLCAGGRLVIADVAAGSRPAAWLDEFVDRFSSEGHTARFLQAEEETERLQSAGFSVRSYRTYRYPWRFASIAQMTAFCRGLFRLDRASDPVIVRGLDEFLGFRELDDGSIGLDWTLAMCRADKEIL
jgi:SAM-dependent methyltransferase